LQRTRCPFPEPPVNLAQTLPTAFPRDCLKAALIYAELGWHVIPVNGKRPVIKNWPNSASINKNQIQQWFPKYTGIGIVTGKKSGLVALDIDPRNGGELSFKRLEETLGRLPRTITAATGGGGWHYLFRWFPGIKTARPAEGIDFQHTSGKMIVAAPSTHPDTGALYEWTVSPLEAELADLPTAWKEYLCANKEPLQGATGLPERIDLYSGPIPQGRRNDTLFRLGCALRDKGLSRKVITIEVQEANLLRCEPPLPDEEAFQIVQNALRTITEGKSMKTRWQEAILSDPALDARAKVVALGLSTFADVNGKSCFPNQEQIAQQTALARKTVGKHLDTLHQTGWIKRYRQSRDAGTGYSYGYVLTLKDG